jgi:hypothetical protein
MPVSRQPLIPRIDLDLMAEYIVADEDRRREMLIDQCVADAEAPRYFCAAEETVCAYLLSIPRRERRVEVKIRALRELLAYAPEKREKITDNIAALEAFLDHPQRELLDGLELYPGPRQGRLRMAGVDIAVCPEIIAAAARTESFGFVKLRFSRRPMEPQEADFLAAMLYAFTQSCAMRMNGRLHLDLTCVVDVFDGTIIRASAVRVGRWARVRAACEEIAANWGMLVSRPSSGISARRKFLG